MPAAVSSVPEGHMACERQHSLPTGWEKCVKQEFVAKQQNADPCARPCMAQTHRVAPPGPCGFGRHPWRW